jgi:uncharacterized protein
MDTDTPAESAPLSPREVFARMQESWLGRGDDGDMLAEDVVIEAPFAPPGRPKRREGRDSVLRAYRPERAAFPVRFEEVRDVVVHETADPEVIVVEYTMAGTVTTTGLCGSAPFIGVLRVRDGKIAGWREYQDALAIAQAVGRLPDLLAAAQAQTETGTGTVPQTRAQAQAQAE